MSGVRVIVVIFHCHYERGGVTQVVENHVRALREHGQCERIILASGERCSGLSLETLQSVELINLEGFDYDPEELIVTDLALRQQQMLRELKCRFADHGVTIDQAFLHWHNHSLGKNTAVPGVIQSLASEGWRILLQVHDFAEDNRPENYGRLVSAMQAVSKQEVDQYLYPQHERLHYATLTRADAVVLRQVGVTLDCLHCLPNSVAVPPGESLSKEDARRKVLKVLELPDEARWSLYPVRGIRRKNIGELLLLARWGYDNRYMGLTLKPTTPMEQRSYNRWKHVAAEVSTRTVFDAGESSDLTLRENVLAADYVVSTSVAEGFGMAFLEPWLLGRGVIARRLNTVADDFEKCGVDLQSFYNSIPIPGSRSWIRECRREILDAQTQAWSHLPAAFHPMLGRSVSDEVETLDFAKLIPQRQIKVLRRMENDRGFELAAKEFSGPLIKSLNEEFSDSVLHSNAEVVTEKYGSICSGEALIQLYRQLHELPSDGKQSVHCISEDRYLDSGIGRVLESPSGIDLINAIRPYFPCRTEVL
jgi:glycosyltransferase involved in cell wall biosynthesis